VADGITADVVHVDCEQAGPAAEPPAEPDEGADPSEGGTAEAPGAEADGETALEALRRIAREDFASVGDELVGSWVPQLSSKRQGANGPDGTWSYEDILAEHQQLRLTFPNVKLLFSTQWNYERRGYWVTVTGLPSSGWRPPLQYCLDSGFDKDHCYAKLLDRRGGPDQHTTWFLTDADRVPRNGPTEPPSS
jgi:serine/threonine-protein kinase